MRRHERVVVSLMVAVGLLSLSACNRLTFVKPNLKKMEIEQVRRPVVAHDNAAVRARMSAQQQIAAAASAFDQGDLVAAEKAARQALKGDPNSVDAHTLLGAIAERRGRAQEAGGWFKKAAQLSQGGAAESVNYGAWLCGNGDPVGALPYFDYAVDLQAAENRADTYANAGTCALRAGLEPRADAYLRKAIELDPANPLALETLAGLALKRGNGMEARAFIQRRLDVKPISASTLSTAAQIETRLGDSRAAAQYLQRMRTEFPNTNTPPPGN